MRPAIWNKDDPEMYWGNPNLYWNYLLEPGDPGYVPPAVPPVTPATETKKKAKKMKHNTYYPTNLPAQVLWLANLQAKLAGHATALGLTTAQVTAALADIGWLLYVLQNWLTAVRSWAQSCTDAATATQTGSGGTQELPVFAAPAPPAGVSPVALGALTRLFALIQQIKASGKCTDDIAADLQIVGSEAGGPDFATLMPVFTVALLNGHVVVKWGWQGFGAWLDSCEIWVDRGDGKGFGFLTIDTTPGYTDTQPLPAVPAKWTYKAVFRQGDASVGNWSAPVALTVGA